MYPIKIQFPSTYTSCITYTYLTSRSSLTASPTLAFFPKNPGPSLTRCVLNPVPHHHLPQCPRCSPPPLSLILPPSYSPSLYLIASLTLTSRPPSPSPSLPVIRYWFNCYYMYFYLHRTLIDSNYL